MKVKVISKYTDEVLELIEKLYFEAAGSQKKDLQKAMAKLVIIKEELESVPDNDKSNKREKIENKDDVYIVSCYLSRFGHEGLFENLNQTQTLKECADILSIKPTSLKGTRDAFDPFFDNGRKGWNGRPLNKKELDIFNKYKSISKEEFLNEVRKILGGKWAEIKNELPPISGFSKMQNGSN